MGGAAGSAVARRSAAKGGAACRGGLRRCPLIVGDRVDPRENKRARQDHGGQGEDQGPIHACRSWRVLEAARLARPGQASFGIIPAYSSGTLSTISNTLCRQGHAEAAARRAAHGREPQPAAPAPAAASTLA